MNNAALRQNKENSMNGFVRWYQRYYNEITWFIIGWLALDMVHEFSHGNWAGVAFDAVLIALNYKLNQQ
jgi:hypothetical protein